MLYTYWIFTILIDTKETPEILQEVVLDLITTEECKTTEALPSDTSVICALTPNKDTCSVMSPVFILFISKYTFGRLYCHHSTVSDPDIYKDQHHFLRTQKIASNKVLHSVV